MLRSSKALLGYVLAAEDGEIGRCKDFLFDDRHWSIRHMVAKTSKWLAGRDVLIPASALAEPRWGERRFSVALEMAQIESSPPLDSDAPISRRYERQLLQHYRRHLYWMGHDATPKLEYPHLICAPTEEEERALARCHLRSHRELTGYRIGAIDGDIGQVDDFIVDDSGWQVRFVVVDTRRWLRGKRVLVSKDWIERARWRDQTLQLDLTIDELRGAPEFDPTAPVNIRAEERRYDFHGRPH